jgi:hypothetical protein
MFNLTNLHGLNRGGRVYPLFKYTQAGLAKNLEKVRNFNTFNLQNVKEYGPLLKLLQSINLPYTTNGERYWDIIEDTYYELAHGVGLTTEISAGKLFTGDIYGDVIDCVYIAYAGELPMIDQRGRLPDWENLEPLTVLHSPVTDLNLHIPLGQDTSTNYGVAVLGVDIPLLAMMLREWRYRENAKPPEERQTIMMFLQYYVFNNTLRSQLNVSLFNNLSRTYNDELVPEPMRKSVTPIVDYSLPVVMNYKEILSDVTRKRVTVSSVLEQIPLSQDTYLADIIPDLPVAPTRAIYWALLLAYIPYLEFITPLVTEFKASINKDYLKRLKRTVRRLRNDRATSAAPNSDVTTYLDQKLELLMMNL